MHEIISALENWLSLNKAVSVATVINTWGSSPRGVGAKMVVNMEGGMAGSVSGGCVEGAVVEESMIVLETGKSRLLHFGVTDEDAWDIGLACGGEIDIFIRPLDWEIFRVIINHWKDEKPTVNAVLIQGLDDSVGEEILFMKDKLICSRKAQNFQNLVENQARDLLENGSSMCRSFFKDNKIKIDFFFDLILPPPILVIVGGVHIAIPLVTFAKELGYKTLVIDPRRQFATIERFPHADQLIQAWPKDAFPNINLNKSTAVAILTHDPKIDNSALECVLSSPIFYLGVLGSTKTQNKRKQRLLDLGFSSSDISKIKGPIGIDLGSKSPEEIALAIMAEIIKTKNEQLG